MAVVSVSKSVITPVNANLGVGSIVNICTPQHDARNRRSLAGVKEKTASFS